MTAYFDKVTQAAEFLRARIGDTPEAAIVLGSGGDFADSLGDSTTIDYGDVHIGPRPRSWGTPASWSSALRADAAFSCWPVARILRGTTCSR
jgi:hypothetical protein